MLLKNANILVVDDDADVLTAMRLLLKSKARNVVVEKNPGNIVSLINDQKFDIIILDMNFNGLINTGNEGIFWLNKIKEIDKEVAIILITAYGDLDLAIRSLKEGRIGFFGETLGKHKAHRIDYRYSSEEKIKDIKKGKQFYRTN